MLYEIRFDNTKNIKLNENIFNCGKNSNTKQNNY